MPALNQPDGIHPNPQGAADRGRHRVECPEAAAGSDLGLMIALRGVSKTVPSGSGTLTILHPLDLVVPARQVMAITGPSGSGKSTLLGLIAGLDSPSTGQIAIDGTDITSLDEDALARLRGRRIGFVFQFFHLLPSLTALENVLVPMEIAGVSGARASATALLQEVGLSERGHHYPSQLSGGEQQRVAIARALANEPPLLLADEPTGNLDSATGHHIIDLLLAINRSRGTTLVLVTHDPELAAVADAAIALRDGHIVSRTAKVGLESQVSGLGVRPKTRDQRPKTKDQRPETRDQRPETDYGLRLPNGGTRTAGVLAPPAVLLHLRGHRCRRHRHAAVDHPERPRRSDPRGAFDDRVGRARDDQPRLDARDPRRAR